MALAVFPAFRCISPTSVSREYDTQTETQVARSGAKLMVDFGGEVERFSFTVRAIGAEWQTLRDFYKARRGEWDPFTWTDPDTGLSHKVQFKGAIQEKDFVPGFTDMTVTVETVP